MKVTDPLTLALIAIAAGVVGVIVLVVLLRLIIRRSRAGKRAQAKALASVHEAKQALAELDRELTELDAEITVTGASTATDAPERLRGRRMRAAHVRSDAFGEYRDLRDGGYLPAITRSEARKLTARVRDATESLRTLRREHADWVASARDTDTLVAAARAESHEVASRIGHLPALVDDLRGTVNHRELAPIEDLIRQSGEARAAADERLAAAPEADEPLVSVAAAWQDLAAASDRARLAEELHRLIQRALTALDDEIDAAAQAVRRAEHILAATTTDSERLHEAVTVCQSAMTTIHQEPRSHPLAAIDAIAGIHEHLDDALEESRTLQQEVFAARGALPVTMAAARDALAQAQLAVPAHEPVDTQCDLDAASDHLAHARRATDPLEAISHARAARHASLRSLGHLGTAGDEARSEAETTEPASAS